MNNTFAIGSMTAVGAVQQKIIGDIAPLKGPRVWPILLVAVLVSLLISVWNISRDGAINNDGILYLFAAELAGDGELEGAYHAYKWPFYPYLIAVVGKIASFSMLFSAHVLNTVFAAVAVLAFLGLLREFGADRRTLIAGAVTVLIYPVFNEYRDFVIRDFGFWSFYLLGIWIFLRYMRTGGWGLALGWAISIGVATLFRIEGLAFLLGMPLVLFLQPRRERLLAFLKANVVAAVITVGLLSWWITAPGQLDAWHGRLYEPVQQLGSLGDRIAQKSEVLASRVLGKHSGDYAPVVLGLGLVIVLLTECVATITPLFALIAVYAVRRRALPWDPAARRLWYWIIGINLLVLSWFLVGNFYLTGRFPVALAFIVLLAVPFGLVDLWDRWQAGHFRGLLGRSGAVALVALLSYMALDGVVSTAPSKAYLKDAGQWIAEHVSEEDRVFVSDAAVAYYAGRIASGDAIRNYDWKDMAAVLRNKRWSQYDYLAVRIGREDPEHEEQFREALRKSPVQSFGNGHGDKVLIFNCKIRLRSDVSGVSPH